MYFGAEGFLNSADHLRRSDGGIRGADLFDVCQDLGGYFVAPFGSTPSGNKPHQALASEVLLGFVESRAGETERCSDGADGHCFFLDTAQHFVFDLCKILGIEEGVFQKQLVAYDAWPGVQRAALAQGLDFRGGRL